MDEETSRKYPRWHGWCPGRANADLIHKSEEADYTMRLVPQKRGCRRKAGMQILGIPGRGKRKAIEYRVMGQSREPSSALAFLHGVLTGITGYSVIIIPICQKLRLREDKQCTEVSSAFGGRTGLEYQEHSHGV